MAQPQSKRRKVMLKFKTGRNHLTVALENALNSFGFSCYSRKLDDWVIYEKYLGPVQVDDDDDEDEYEVPDLTELDLNFRDLPEETILNLEARLNKIVDAYLDPYSHTAAIRAQCMMLADSLPHRERDWVICWVAETIDKEYYGGNYAPWEDGQHIGSC